jgi:CheY-like chemotaxis protein
MGPPHILLVDDDDDLRELLAELLHAHGFRVAVARHGAEALDLLSRGERPSLIVLDYMMPVMDGPTFLATKLRDERLAAIPVFLLTAMGDAARDPACASATRCLRKPLPVADLVLAINQALGLPAKS